jgi:hypothetical protein
MKNMNYLFKIIYIACILFIAGCSHDNMDIIETNPQELSLNLVAPNGIKIAEDIDALKSSSAEILSFLNRGFEITGIEYFTCEKGFIATVKYMTDDGETGMYVLIYND